jgi:hypothetical protein
MIEDRSPARAVHKADERVTLEEKLRPRDGLRNEA